MNTIHAYLVNSIRIKNIGNIYNQLVLKLQETKRRNQVLVLHEPCGTHIKIYKVSDK